jgi:hypothetical protein
MVRYVELRRHTDSDGDALTEEGVRAALDIGRRLHGGYELLVSSGAQRGDPDAGLLRVRAARAGAGRSSGRSRVALARRGSLARCLPAGRQRRWLWPARW